MSLKAKLNSTSPVVKAAAVYTIASFLVKGLHLITTPLFTRVMTVEQIGEVTNYATWLAYFSTVVAIGLTSGAINIALKEYKDDRAGYVKSSQTVLIISVIVFGLLTWLLFPYISSFMGMPWHYVIVMFVAMMFTFSQHNWMAWQRYEYRYKAVAGVTIGSSVLVTVVSLLAVVWAKNKGIEDLSTVRIYTQTGVALLFSVPIFIYIQSRKKPLINKKYTLFSLQIGLPMVVHAFSKTLLSASDKTMINAMIGARALGLYSILYVVSSLSIIVWESINTSFVPYFFEKLDSEKDNTKTIRKISFVMLAVFGAVSFLLALFAPELVMIIGGEQYMEAVYVAPPVCAGIFFIALYSLYGNVLMYYKKTNYVMLCTLAAAVFNVVTNIIFIPMFGYIAAAYTTLASYAFMALVYCVISKRIADRIIYNNRAFWLISVIVVGLCLMCNLLYINTIVRYAVIGSMLIVLLCLRRPILATIKQIRKK